MGVIKRKRSTATMDPQVAAYFKAGNITDPTEQKAVSAFIATLKSAGIYSRLERLYLMSPTSSAAGLLDFITLTSATNNGASHGTSGWTFNGISGYIDTGFIPFNSTIMSQHDMSFGVYCNSGTAGTIGAFGGANNTSLQQLGITATASGSNTTFSYYTNTLAGSRFSTYTANNMTSLIGFHISTRTSSLRMDAYVNSRSIANTNASSSGNLVDEEIYLGAINASGTPTTYLSCRLGLAFIGRNIPASMMATFARANIDYQRALGRYVYFPLADTYFTNAGIPTSEVLERFAAEFFITELRMRNIWDKASRIYLRSPYSQAAALMCAKTGTSQTAVNSPTHSSTGLYFDGVSSCARSDVAVSALSEITTSSAFIFLYFNGAQNAGGYSLAGCEVGGSNAYRLRWTNGLV